MADLSTIYDAVEELPSVEATAGDRLASAWEDGSAACDSASAGANALSPYEQVKRTVNRAVAAGVEPSSELHERLGRRIEQERAKGVAALLASESARELVLEWAELAQCDERTVEAAYSADDDEANYSGGDALLEIVPGGNEKDQKEALGAVYSSLLPMLVNGGNDAQRQAIAQRLPLSWDGFLRLSRAAQGELTSAGQDKVDASYRAQTAIFNQFVQANLRLLKAKAGLHRARRDSYEDVFQEAVLGLTRAVQLWDYRKGFQFSTFAEPWIRQMANLELYKVGRLVAPRTRSLPTYSKAEATRGAMAQALGREPSDREVAAKLEMSVLDLQALMVECAPAGSLDAPVDGTRLLTHLEHVEDETDFVAELECDGTARAVRDACHALNPVEREMVTMRFGLDGKDPISNEEMAERMGLRRETARLLFKRALGKLRTGPLGAMLAEELERAP